MTLPKVLRGKAWKFGVNIDTDQIIPAKYAIYSLDEKELGKHAMEGVPGREGWAAQVSTGDILVAGSNFGCGSSREIAPIAIRGAGIFLSTSRGCVMTPVTALAAATAGLDR